MGPRPTCSPFWFVSDLGGALVHPFPDESGSSGHPGSAFREDDQPFYQLTIIGSRIYFRFLVRKRKEALLHSNPEEILFVSLVSLKSLRCGSPSHDLSHPKFSLGTVGRGRDALSLLLTWLSEHYQVGDLVKTGTGEVLFQHLGSFIPP